MVLHWVEGVCHDMALVCVTNTENWKLKKIGVLIKYKPSRFALAFPKLITISDYTLTILRNQRKYETKYMCRE